LYVGGTRKEASEKGKKTSLIPLRGCRGGQWAKKGMCIQLKETKKLAKQK